jgi:aromatase
MPRALASISIACPPEHAFDVTNDVARWPELFGDYMRATVISARRERSLSVVELRQGHDASASWRSLRILDHERRLVVAQRVDPLPPFLFVHVTWRHVPVEGGVLVTWTQDFEMEPAAAHMTDGVLANVSDAMHENQRRIKEILEAS